MSSVLVMPMPVSSMVSVPADLSIVREILRAPRGRCGTRVSCARAQGRPQRQRRGARIATHLSSGSAASFVASPSDSKRILSSACGASGGRESHVLRGRTRAAREGSPQTPTQPRTARPPRARHALRAARSALPAVRHAPAREEATRAGALALAGHASAHATPRSTRARARSRSQETHVAGVGDQLAQEDLLVGVELRGRGEEKRP